MSQKYSEILYAGTAGTGKTFTVCAILCMLAQELDGIRIGVFRKNLTTARKTVWHTYVKALNLLEIPNTAVLGSEPKIRLTESGSVIEFFEMDITKDPDWMKLKGLELTMAHMDEGNEIPESGKNILISRIGRWKPELIKPCILVTCNPSQGWVREQFRDPSENRTIELHRAFIQASADELDSDYMALLSTLPELEKSRYLENNWDFLEDPNQLIRYEWCKANLIDSDIIKPNRLGVDVSREGKDKSVIHRAYKDADKAYLLSSRIVNTTDVTVLGDNVMQEALSLAIASKDVIVDAIGVGGGTIDHLNRKGFRVTEYKGGYAVERPEGFLFYANQRAKDYWLLREGLREGKIKLTDDPELIKQLINIKYFITDKVIKIEDKIQIKKRLGYSPDHADAAVMAISEVNNNRFTFAFA